MPEFHIIPILGRRNDVPANDPSLFQPVSEGTVLTHDVGGLNFDLARKRNVCSKAFGYEAWDAAANSQATKCLGLFMLDDGTNRDYIFFDNGRFHVYHTTLEPYEAVLNFDAGTDAIVAGDTITDGSTSTTGVVLTVTVTSGDWATNDAAGYLRIHTITGGSGTFGDGNTITSSPSSGSATVDGALTVVTFATDNKDLYSIIRVGSDMVFADRGETTPYKWANGDDYITKLIDPSGGSGYTEYKFRYLMYFMQRIVGLYTAQTNGDIDIRWTAALPDLSSDVEFAAANQLYVPNDDPIVGGGVMGVNRSFIYSENSIHELAYYPDYVTPFRCFTVIPGHGGVNHHSIVAAHNQHYLFNRDFGFCMYDGGRQFPTGRPISDSIEADIAGIDPEYYDLIVGTPIPILQKIAWAVPSSYSTVPDQLWFYDLRTQQWTFEDKPMSFVDTWRLFTTYTWNNMISDYGDGWGNVASLAWAQFIDSLQRLVYAQNPTNADGKLYAHKTETDPAGNLDGHRIEPILDFGDPYRKDLFKAIWFEIVETGSFSIDVYHRGGNTVGEVENEAWTSLGSISCDNPLTPAIRDFAKSARLHQIKWGTDNNNEKFAVNKITLVFDPQSRN